jgi:uncharacterized protein YfeS
MNYKDNIEWLKSLKQQIGKTQHYDLWHFEQVIDETIENLKLLATFRGRLIDAERLIAVLKSTTAISQSDYDLFNHIVGLIEHQPAVIESEQGDG